MEEERIQTKRGIPIFSDIRRYTCEYCAIVRSKKKLINDHIQSHHQDKLKEKEGDGETEEKRRNVCKECDASFQKPAHLKQHKQSHSLERSHICPMEDCNNSYRRKDHLNRHLIQHQGKIFPCTIKNCKIRFSIKGNLTRHMKEIHDDVDCSPDTDTNEQQQKIHTCSEPGCGKVFKYPSRLQKHEESHIKLQTEEACGACMKFFTNKKCLNDHIQSCHQHINCKICGRKQLKRNMNRHLKTHEKTVCEKRIKCSFDGCDLTFSNNSNLAVHVKAVHYQEKPFVCSVSGCGERFAFKHVRDNHEKSGKHVYVVGDFVEGDDEFRSRERGGVKRKMTGVIDALMRKRVLPPTEFQGSDYISWLMSARDEEE